METRGQAIKHLTPGVETGIQKAQTVYAQGISKRFFSHDREQLTDIKNFHQFVATPMKSTKWKEVLAMFGRVPAVTEDTVTKAGANVREYSYEVIVKNWSTHFSVDNYTLDDDQTGDIRLLGQTLMDQFLYHMDYHVFVDVLAAAAASTPVGPDGVSLINDAHLPSQDNNLATALTEANLHAALEAMEGFTDFDGQQNALSAADLLCVHRTLKKTAIQLTASMNRSADGTIWAATGAPVMNPVAVYDIDVLVVPFWTSATMWHAVDRTKAILPVLFLDRMKPTLSVTQPGSDTEVLQNKTIFVGRGRYRAAAGWPLGIIRGNA